MLSLVRARPVVRLDVVLVEIVCIMGVVISRPFTWSTTR